MDAIPGILIAVFLGFFAALVAYTAAKSAVVRFRWRVLGRVPAIHDDDLVRRTADACAREALAGREPGEPTEKQRAELAATYRFAIEAYIENFTLQL